MMKDHTCLCDKYMIKIIPGADVYCPYEVPREIFKITSANCG
jgi:hypothetical protein